MKHLKKLKRTHKELLRKNNFYDEYYLVERDLPEGVMFVDRLKTHRLYYDRKEKVFSRLQC